MRHRVNTRCAKLALLLAGVLVLSACASKTEVFSTDLTRQQGLYIVGYTTNSSVRHALEDQLVADLAERGMIAYPSYPDVLDLAQSSAPEVIRAANRKQAVGVVLINQATAEAGASPVQDPARVTPLHPDIQAFYSQSRDEMVDEQAADKPVFAEVNLFLVDGSATRLFWSGTTWSFHADGKGTALRGISETIAQQMVKARDEYDRSNVFSQ